MSDCSHAMMHTIRDIIIVQYSTIQCCRHRVTQPSSFRSSRCKTCRQSLPSIYFRLQTATHHWGSSLTIRWGCCRSPHTIVAPQQSVALGFDKGHKAPYTVYQYTGFTSSSVALRGCTSTTPKQLSPSLVIGSKQHSYSCSCTRAGRTNLEPLPTTLDASE